MKKNLNLTDLFQSEQNKMESMLGTSSSLLHPVDNGDNSEKAWIEFLRKYLPERYKISKATVIDSAGRSSDQLDIVIYDQQYSYLVFNDNGITYVPAESVYAAFEVKPEVNSKYLDYSSKKAHSLRTLKRTSAKIPTANGLLPPKELHEILFGFLANRSKNKNLFTKSFIKHLQLGNKDYCINCGCCLEKGSFFIEENGLQISKGSPFLVHFVLRLVQELQKIGTVPAIDFDAYLSNPCFNTNIMSCDKLKTSTKIR